MTLTVCLNISQAYDTEVEQARKSLSKVQSAFRSTLGDSAPMGFIGTSNSANKPDSYKSVERILSKLKALNSVMEGFSKVCCLSRIQRLTTNLFLSRFIRI